ncbi:MAG: OmpH family outer membrane protein [Bacteroidia bacterium]|nr:OmpH family outer membrane protein [Bacteroidia bacterium]
MNKWLLPAGVVLAVVLSVLAFAGSFGTQKVAYVKMEELYNSFQMKQQLEKKLKDTEQARKLMLDSARLRLQLMEDDFRQLPKADTSSFRFFNQKQREYYAMEQQFNQDNQILAQQYTDQIWAQINQYAKDFGKQEGYDFIFGASGDGALMYANEATDLTEKMKVYINEKYQGKTK